MIPGGIIRGEGEKGERGRAEMPKMDRKGWGGGGGRWRVENGCRRDKGRTHRDLNRTRETNQAASLSNQIQIATVNELTMAPGECRYWRECWRFLFVVVPMKMKI
jgi:hypothetical protein